MNWGELAVFWQTSNHAKNVSTTSFLIVSGKTYPPTLFEQEMDGTDSLRAKKVGKLYSVHGGNATVNWLLVFKVGVTDVHLLCCVCEWWRNLWCSCRHVKHSRDGSCNCQYHGCRCLHRVLGLFPVLFVLNLHYVHWLHGFLGHECIRKVYFQLVISNPEPSASYPISWFNPAHIEPVSIVGPCLQ